MRNIVLAVMGLVFLLGSNALSQSPKLPSEPNINNAWSQGTMDGIRIYYGYTSPEPENFHCRCDYYYDGSIRLLAVQGYYHIPDSPVSTVTTFYSLRPTPVRQLNGSELVMISYKTLSGPNLKVEPTITTEDIFTKRCIPLLGDLFKQISTQEVKMFKDQYGQVFSIK